MTKIDQIHETIAMQSAKRPLTPTQVSFSASLENALSPKMSNDAEIGRASALCEPKPSIPNPSGASLTDVVGQADKLLGLLESYATGLENPKTSLKELASIVALMKNEARQLMASADKHAAEGDALNGIASKAALTASVEYIKFNRGDYL